MDWPEAIVNLVAAFAWPLVVLAMVFYFRNEISDILPNISKISLPGGVSIETARMDRYEPSGDITAALSRPAEAHAVAAGVQLSSHMHTLKQAILGGGSADYLLVDLGRGNRWLTSRLFLFAAVLPDAIGIRALVFLEERNPERVFVGSAPVQVVRRRLARVFPWLEQAYTKRTQGCHAGSARSLSGIT